MHLNTPNSEIGAAKGMLRLVWRYFLVGLANTAATFILYQALLFLTEYRMAYSLSFVAGIVLSYLGHSRFTFKTSWHIGKAIGYALAYLLTYWIGLELLVFEIETLGIHEVVAPIFVLTVVVPLNFLATRAVLSVVTKQPRH